MYHCSFVASNQESDRVRCLHEMGRGEGAIEAIPKYGMVGLGGTIHTCMYVCMYIIYIYMCVSIKDHRLTLDYTFFIYGYVGNYVFIYLFTYACMYVYIIYI